jgi:SAM-dependent methyltransferase
MMDLKTQLQPIFDRVGHENIWRPIYDREKRLIARGRGKFYDIIPETLQSVDFNGKTVVDLGCNFGYYTFLAARLGARKVVGIDINREIIRGCEILGAHFGLPNVEFRAVDFTKSDVGEIFDVGMMIDFIGKSTIKRFRLQGCLAALGRLSRSEMLLTLRPEYDIEGDLGMNLDEFGSGYPSKFIRNKRFHLLDFVRATFGETWDMQVECHERCRKHNLKSPVHFIRKYVEYRSVSRSLGNQS